MQRRAEIFCSLHPLTRFLVTRYSGTLHRATHSGALRPDHPVFRAVVALFLHGYAADAVICRFKVMDDERLGDDLAAWACFRLDRLQPGLRMLHLYDANGVVTNGVLLVRIRKTVSKERTMTW
jgi:hypothetical protein